MTFDVRDPTAVIRRHFPALEFQEVRVVEDGWDSLVLELDATWMLRFPRRSEVAQWLEQEIALLPELAPSLPVEIPRFDLIARNGVLCVGYRKLIGEPAHDLSAPAGADLARFLSALHRFPAARARDLGIPYFGPAAWREEIGRVCSDFRQRVFPLLRSGERQRAELVFARVSEIEFDPVLVHGDLGPAHVLYERQRVTAVIDWSDARVGDPALDLAWCLNGTAPNAADVAARTYGVSEELRARTLFYHRLGPWYEVVYGLQTGQDRFVASGLEGVRARLPSLTPSLGGA